MLAIKFRLMVTTF